MKSAGYFDADEMLAAATRDADWADWGEEDIRPHFEVLVNSLNTDADLSEAGRERAKSHLHTILTARLRLLRDRKNYPGITQEKIRRPIFLTGAQRSGTSYLYSLLTSDIGNIGFYNWQFVAPSPPPNHPDTDQAAQILRADHVLAREGWLESYVREKHDYSASVATEDVFIHEMSFISVNYAFFWGATGYAKYIANADYRSPYRFERKFLQALQFGGVGQRLVLKSPLHLSMLGPLFDVFPDARIVVSHRDPRKLFGSLMSLMAAQRRQFGCPFTADRALALALMEGVASGYEDMIRRRKNPAVDSNFIDVNYLDLERNPIGEITRIYRRFGMELNDGAEASMRKYVAENRKGKYGKHQYKLEDSGLTEAEVMARFQFYADAYDVQWED